jgi:hypothetical protein
VKLSIRSSKNKWNNNVGEGLEMYEEAAAFILDFSSAMRKGQRKCDCHCFIMQIMPAVQDPSLLASHLLVIVGQRMCKIVTNSPDMRCTMSRLSPSLSTWLESLVSTC